MTMNTDFYHHQVNQSIFRFPRNSTHNDTLERVGAYSSYFINLF